MEAFWKALRPMLSAVGSIDSCPPASLGKVWKKRLIRTGCRRKAGDTGYSLGCDDRHRGERQA